MVKEWIIAVYLTAFRVIFSFFKLWPMKPKKVVFVVSFGQNSLYVNQEIARRKAGIFKVVFLYKVSVPYDFKQMKDVQAFPFETANIVHMLMCIYHLATCKYVIIDNYYGFLSVTNFKKNAECIQLWHAVGALKTFGLTDRTIQQRSAAAQRRFLKVYASFDKVVVGSEAMVNIFTKAFNLLPHNILRSGVPRTDFFYDKFLQAEMAAKMNKENPILTAKKVILYAPTFRDGELEDFDIQLDLGLMQQFLGEEYVIALRLHPAIQNNTNYEVEFPGFVYDYSSCPEINTLLVIADYLITDYSSIPYEYALLNKPMVFFCPDLNEYAQERGLWEDYRSSVPGPVVYTTAEVISAIQLNVFDMKQIQSFAWKWNQYSDGQSSRHIVDYLCGDELDQTLY